MTQRLGSQRNGFVNEIERETERKGIPWKIANTTLGTDLLSTAMIEDLSGKNLLFVILFHFPETIIPV